MDMANWNVERYTISLNSEGQRARAEVRVDGIVLRGVIGIHRDQGSGSMSITHIETGKRMGPPLFHIGEAIREAQRLWGLGAHQL
jgi:hypothetical protein